MAMRAYKLREVYVESSLAGLYHDGHGNEYNLSDLKDSGNEISTDDFMFQDILGQMQGAMGPLFDVFEVGEGGETTPVDQSVVDNPDVIAQPTAASIPDAQHGDESEYNSFTVDELKSTLDERGVQYAAKATKADLVAALEASDREGVINA